ncbi:hypothetical protein JTB14_029332 [Gonioctena quinquepunctata]|nr:hypothetical protein JTB14_029332 [Gonioctena quinquepunctata]
MDMYDINAFSEDEEEVRWPKIIRPRPNFFDRCRLSPRSVEMIIEESEIQSNIRQKGMTVYQQVIKNALR